MNLEDEAKIKSIEKFEISEDEVILIKISNESTHNYTTSIARAMRKNFPNNTIIFANEDTEFQIFKPKKEL